VKFLSNYEAKAPKNNDFIMKMIIDLNHCYMSNISSNISI